MRRTCDGPHTCPGPAHPHPEGRRCYCRACERARNRWAWSLPEACQEVGQTGRCRAGHPVSALPDVVAGRIYSARISPDDPGLTLLRAWNAAALVRTAVAGITDSTKEDTARRRANGESTGLLREHGPDICPASAEESAPDKRKAPRNGELVTTESTWTRSHRLAGLATGPTNTQRS